MYDTEGGMLGFCRVLTDYVVFAYLMDFFIVEEHQQKGLGTQLAQHIFEYPDFQEVRLWFLGTHSAHGLYEKFGFKKVDVPDRFMFRRDERNL